ncbi:MAG: penicillin-binding protein 2 [Acidobacteria bacterium]|nr:penicillin-binding protein 2 [Acidobacteriota bacterium]
MNRDDKVPQYKLTVVQYCLLAVLLVLGYGMWRLQVLHSETFESLAERNRVREVPILAPRGKILDREGRIIVDNYPSFSVLLLRDQKRDLNADAALISQGLGLSPEEIRSRIRKAALGHAPESQPIVLKDDITPNDLAFIEAHKVELPEIETIMVHRRLYPKNGFAAHLIGYVGEVSEDMLNQPQYELYEPGMIVGKSGVEKSYNDLLMGKDGQRRVEVDSRGRELRHLSDSPAVAGQPLKLTIDLDIQIAAEQAIGDKPGAIVAMDPHTGEILAMVSRPTFDPNAFAVRVSRQEWSRLVSDPGKPLLNKAIQAQLAPGSVFKIIMSLAGLQEGVAQSMNVHCAGGAVFYGRRFACWVKSGHGAVDVTKAIYQSCDVFFYTLAEKLGIGKIAKYADELGLGHKTGIDLNDEASGLMPSEEWKIKNFKQKWFAGETISVGIGQGAVTVTPVQLTRAISGIAMGGLLETPHVVMMDDLQNPDLKKAALEHKRETRVELDPKNWETITDAMARVTLPEGTAPSAHLQNIDLTGKTGSAQTMSNALAQKLGHSHTVGDNGWFVGFAPRRNPDIVVGVLFESGDHGYLAARLAAQVIKAYVDKQRRHELEIRKAEAGDDGPAPTLATIQDKYSPPPKQGSQPQKVAAAASGDIAQNRGSDFDFTGVWHEDAGDEHQLGSGSFTLPKGPPARPAKAAPGMQ